MDADALLTQIRVLSTGSPDDAPHSLARIEETLTAGYAHALALEADRWRLERRLIELAAAFADGPGDRRAEEIAALARQMSSTDGDLVRLRTALASLRDRAVAVRALA